VDAIQEFSVLTANYSAEYGFTSGGVINAITKSGTNQFHGSAFEFVRNKAFDSSNYLTPGNKPPFVRNQFGSSAGWKVLKDKAFLFGAYEGLRQRKGIPVTAKVISNDARLGIVHDQNGVLITTAQGITNTWLTPTGGCTNPNSTLLSPAAPLCVDNTVKAYIDALDPLPQPTAIVKGDFASNIYSGVQGVTDNYFTLRSDLKISDKDSVDAEYYRDHSSWSKPNSFDNSTSGYILPNQTGSIEENHIFSRSMVNSLRFGYTNSIVRNPGLTHSLAAQVDPAFGILPTTFGPGESGQGGGGAGVTGMTSFGGFSPQGGFSDWVENFQVFDDVFRTFGNHSLKFGVEVIRNHTNLINGNGNGSAGFGVLPNFLQNEPFTVREPTVPPFTAGNTKHYNRESIFGVYVQDDWKMKPNLTVNVGLRYEMATIPNEKNGKFILLPTLWTDPGNCSEDINGLPIAATCAGLANKVFDSNPTLKNFEPRVGFSWDPFKTGKTTIRAGFGVFDVLPLPYPDGAFSLVTSRFAFHHFLEPAAVLAEMTRVCAPGGQVAVIDSEASPDSAKAAEFNRMEKLRDPSHVRAMPLAELKGLFAPSGLPAPRVTSYRLEGELESLLGRSFPLAGDADRIRGIFAASLGDDRLGIPMSRDGDRIRYAYPVAVLVAGKPAA